MKHFLYTSFVLLAIGFAPGCKGPEAVSDKKEESALNNKQEIALTSRFIDANREKILGNDDEALKGFLTCLSINPKHHASMYEIARILQRKGRLEEALVYGKMAAESDPSNKWYLIQLAHTYEALKRHDESAQVYARLRKMEPYNMEFAYQHAGMLLYAGKTKEAIEVYDNIEEMIGVTEEISVQKEKLYLRENKVEEAIEEIEKLITAYPNESRYYGMLAELYASRGLYEKALETYTKAEQRDPENPFIHLSLAEFYERTGDAEKGNSYLEKAFSNPNLSIDTKVGMLLKMYQAAEMNQSIENRALVLSELMTHAHPGEAKAFAMYGDFLYQDRQLEKARDAYRQAITLDESKFLIWSQLLIIDSELNDMPQMLEDSKRAMELFPSQPTVYFFNGVANNQQKDHTAAISALETGLELVYGNPFLQVQMLASLGDAYHHVGQYKQSDSAYASALDYDPDNLYVLNNYSYFLSLRGEDLEKAAAMSFKTIQAEPTNASYLDTYGWILYRQGNYTDAIQYLGKALENGGGESAEVLEHYGDAQYKLGNLEEALNSWKTARKHGEGSEFLDKKIATQQLHE